MFCPRCKSEYREGFTKCSDCKILLVEELPIEKETQSTNAEYIDMEFILSTLKYTDIAFIKSIFEDREIVYYIQGENMGVTPGGIAARVLVKKEQIDEARLLLREHHVM